VRDRLLCGPAREFCRDVAEELQRDPADVAVVDTMIPSAMFGAEVTGVRAVIVMHGPYMIPRADVPPLGTGLMPARGPLGRLRDRSAAAVTLAVFRSAMPALNRARAEAGLPPVRDLPDLMSRADRVLVCSSPSYDFGSGSVPANVRYVGPQLDDDPGETSGEQWAGEPADFRLDDLINLGGGQAAPGGPVADRSSARTRNIPNQRPLSGRAGVSLAEQPLGVCEQWLGL